MWETYACPQISILCGKIKSIWSPFYCYTCQNVFSCRHQLSISWGTCTCCSPEPTQLGRGHCLTVLDAFPVTLAVRVTARRPCSWLNLILTLAHWHQSVCSFLKFGICVSWSPCTFLKTWTTRSQMWCQAEGPCFLLHECALWPLQSEGLVRQQILWHQTSFGTSPH